LAIVVPTKTSPYVEACSFYNKFAFAGILGDMASYVSDAILEHCAEPIQVLAAPPIAVTELGVQPEAYQVFLLNDEIADVDEDKRKRENDVVLPQHDRIRALLW
jgi:hypothetical protein